MPAEQALADSNTEIRKILERIHFYDDSFAEKWQIEGFQIADHCRLQISDFGKLQAEKLTIGRGQGFQSAILNNLKSKIIQNLQFF